MRRSKHSWKVKAHGIFPLGVAVSLCVCCCARCQGQVKEWLVTEPAVVSPGVPHQALGALECCHSSPWLLLSLPPDKVDSATSGAWLCLSQLGGETEHYRAFQSITEHFRAFQSITEHYRAMEVQAHTSQHNLSVYNLC